MTNIKKKSLTIFIFCILTLFLMSNFIYADLVTPEVWPYQQDSVENTSNSITQTENTYNNINDKQYNTVESVSNLSTTDSQNIVTQTNNSESSNSPFGIFEIIAGIAFVIALVCFSILMLIRK